jgi:transcription elongation GreA/GreB family factor
MSVAFVREESAEAAQEITLPERPISTHPNLVTQWALKALESATAESGEALKAAQGIEDANERRRALELAARDARYFSERLASAILRPEPESAETVTFGHRVTILRDGQRRQTYRIVGEDEADPRRIDFLCRSARAPPHRQARRRHHRHGPATRSRSSKSREARERHRGETDGAPLSRRACKRRIVPAEDRACPGGQPGAQKNGRARPGAPV